MKDSCGFIKATIQERLIDDYSGLFDLSVIRDSTVNMNWAISGIRDGDLSASFTASVINLLKDASIVIESMDNAGNSTRSRYTYTAPKISIPDTLSFKRYKKEILSAPFSMSEILVKIPSLSNSQTLMAMIDLDV